MNLSSNYERLKKNSLNSRRKRMKFIVLGKYTKQGTDGWLDNPDEDRHAMISELSKKIGGNLLDLSYTRGEYDVVATMEAPSLDTMTALKLSMSSS